ncbi:hypothetical protein [Tumebacillus sp. BK434]|nr:hypothetical protein [Tumebacillus sp. BK434]
MATEQMKDLFDLDVEVVMSANEDDRAWAYTMNAPCAWTVK